MPKMSKFTVTCIAYLSAIFLLVLLQILASLGCFNYLSDQVIEVVFSVVPQIGVMFLVPFVIMVVYQRRTQTPQPVTAVWREVHWGKVAGKNVLLAFLLGVCLYILNIFVASFFANILQALGYQFTSNDNVFHGVGGLFITLFLTAVLPGLCEEFLHRGVLLRGLIPQMGVYRAVLWTSILFGLMHMNIGQFFFTAILGWFIAMAVLASGSLWVGMIIHFTNNALSVYFSYADELSLPGATIVNNIFANPIIFVLTLLIVFIAIGEIIRHLAKQNFAQHRDWYTMRYLAAQSGGQTAAFDQVKDALGQVIKTMPTWKATFAYVETYDKPQKMRPLEKALFSAIFILGSIITVLSFIWGTW